MRRRRCSSPRRRGPWGRRNRESPSPIGNCEAKRERERDSSSLFFVFFLVTVPFWKVDGSPPTYSGFLPFLTPFFKKIFSLFFFFQTLPISVVNFLILKWKCTHYMRVIKKILVGNDIIGTTQLIFWVKKKQIWTWLSEYGLR